MQRRIAFIIFLCVIGIVLNLTFISFASAEVQSLPTVKQNTCAVLKQTCASCTDVNVTQVSLPNGTINTLGSYMNNKKPNFDYNFCSTSLIGTYIVSTCGDVNADLDFTCLGCCVDYDFQVTPSGVSQSVSQGIGSFSFIIIMFGLTILIGYLGFKFSESKTIWVLGMFFIFLSLLFMVYDVWLGYQYYLNYTGESDAGMPETIFYIFMFILVAGLLVSMALLFLKWKKIYRYVKRELKSKDEADEIDNEFERF